MRIIFITGIIFSSAAGFASKDSSVISCSKLFSVEAADSDLYPKKYFEHKFPVRGTQQYEKMLQIGFSMDPSKRIDFFQKNDFAVADIKERPRINFSLTRMLELIRDLKISNIEDLLSNIPIELRSNLILMTRSESLHYASPEQPRIILYNHDATLLMAFSGARDKPNSNRVEIIDYNRERESFEFSSIEFNGREPGRVKKERKRCIGCHGSSNGNQMHPIWDTYPLWPGAMTSLDIGLKPVERENITNFINSVKTPNEKNLRYIQLAITPRLDSTMKHGIDYLSIKLGELNADRIISTFFEHPKFLQYSEAIESALRGSGEESTIKLLPNKNKEYLRQRLKVIYQLTKQGADAYLDNKIARQTMASGPNSFYETRDVEVENIALLRLVAEEMGIFSDHWWMNKTPNLVDFNDPLDTGTRRLSKSWRDQLRLRFNVDRASKL